MRFGDRFQISTCVSMYVLGKREEWGYEKNVNAKNGVKNILIYFPSARFIFPLLKNLGKSSVLLKMRVCVFFPAISHK